MLIPNIAAPLVCIVRYPILRGETKPLITPLRRRYEILLADVTNRARARRWSDARFFQNYLRSIILLVDEFSKTAG